MFCVTALLLAATPAAQVAPDARCSRALGDALRRSRAVELVATAPELLVDLRDAGPRLTLELRRPTGERLLERSLDANPECRDVAFAAVLIIERFLRGIDLQAVPDAGVPAPIARRPPPRPPPPLFDAGVPEEVPPEPDETFDAGPPHPVPLPYEGRGDAGFDAGEAEAPRRPIAVASFDAGPPPPSGPRLTRVELGASGGVDFSSAAHGLFAVELTGFAGPARVDVQAQLSTPESSPVVIASTERGRVETLALAALAGGGACFTGAVRLCAAAHAGARFFRGTTSGDFVFQSTTVWLVRPTFGLEAQLAWLPLRALVLWLSAGGLVNPIAAEFTVEGAPAATRRSPTFEGQLRIGVGWGVDR